MMKKFALITNGAVEQVQPYPQTNFIQCPNFVVATMLFDGVDYSNPPVDPPQTAAEAFEQELRTVPFMRSYVRGRARRAGKSREEIRAEMRVDAGL